MEKADEIEKLFVIKWKANSGWLHRFQQQHDIIYKRIQGELKSVDASVVGERHVSVLMDLLINYQPADLYNAEETGVFFQMLPDKILNVNGDDAHGTKSCKERLTVLVCSNMAGTDKVPLLVIGKSKNPSCFKHIESLPTEYEANTKAWMTSEIFTKWIKKFNSVMKLQNRKVAVILDNCQAHPNVKGLTNTKLVFLSPNTTMDAAHGPRHNSESQRTLQACPHQQDVGMY